MKPTREQILANREALTQALSEDRITRHLNGTDSAVAWAQFEGRSPRGAKALFDLTYDMGKLRFGTTGELMPVERLTFHVGSDASFRTYHAHWSTAWALSAENAKAVERSRREILSMFSPDGEESRVETVAFLDAAFGSVREAALSRLDAEASPSPMR